MPHLLFQPFLSQVEPAPTFLHFFSLIPHLSSLLVLHTVAEQPSFSCALVSCALVLWCLDSPNFRLPNFGLICFYYPKIAFVISLSLSLSNIFNVSIGNVLSFIRCIESLNFFEKRERVSENSLLK